MENFEKLTWKEKMDIFKKELWEIEERKRELESKAQKMLGFNLKNVEEWLNRRPLGEFFERANIQHLKMINVPTSGAPLFILSSKLYPEVGFLVFDGPGNGANYAIAIPSLNESETRRLSTVCTCCSPERVGQPGRRIGEKFVQFILEIGVKNGIQHLLLQCDEGGESGHSLVTEFNSQNVIQIHDLQKSKRRMEGIDQWHFAAAFVEISSIGKEERPFLGLFKDR